jgi:hypothetical protein
MMSWWDFGESRGYSGQELATHQISCPFCPEKGNFKVEHHLEKKNCTIGPRCQDIFGRPHPYEREAYQCA